MKGKPFKERKREHYEGKNPQTQRVCHRPGKHRRRKARECWEKLEAILEDYKKEGKSVYTPTFIEDNEDKVKALQQEYGFAYTIELK